MSSILVRPRVADLVFQLYGRPLHPELFDILSVRKFQREDYELRVWITRTGHVFTWENDDVLLTEVADAEQSLPEKRRFIRYVMRGEHAAKFQCCHNILYQTSFQVETMSEPIFMQVHSEILADGSKRGVLHQFQPSHRFAVAPLGLVVVETRMNCLFLSTFHTFPDENTVIKSQTLIEKQV